jgi:predicted thioredoxin/glutaredoxin
MVSLKKTSINELPELIAISYQGDQDLFDKYHIIKQDFESCVDHTMKLILEMADQYELKYYKVLLDKKAIGYVVTADILLFSFCIGIKWREKKVLKEWWSKIKHIMGADFVASLYMNNTRGINWLLKCGMSIIKEDKENNCVILANL